MRNILSLFFAFCFISATAQTEADIRQHYASVNQQIEESISHGMEGPLYNNQWVVNKNGKSWPAVGNYKETTDFWYNDPPDHLGAKDRDPKQVLLKIVVTRHASHLLSTAEYLFKDGRLVFYYTKEGEEGKEYETRIWYTNKGIAFKTAVKVDGKELQAKDFLTEEFRDMKPLPAIVMNNAKDMQQLFLQSMNQ